MQQQVPPTIISQPGIAIPTTLATSQQVTPVSYPNPRVLQQQNTSPNRTGFLLCQLIEKEYMKLKLKSLNISIASTELLKGCLKVQ
jgi:hypothetical protein